MSAATAERTIRASGLSVVDLSARIEQRLSEASGVSTTSSSFDHFQVARTVRPNWTIVLSIILFPLGLIFLLVRDVRTANVRLVEGPRGAMATVTGPLADEVVALLGDLRERTADAEVPMTSATPRASVPFVASPTPTTSPPTLRSAAAPRGSAVPVRRLVADGSHLSRPDDATVIRSTAVSRPWVSAMSRPAAMIHLPGGASLDLRELSAVVLGRAPEQSDGVTAVPIPDDQEISKSHARVSNGPLGVSIEDLHSTNGTWIVTSAGDTRIAPMSPVTIGDTVTVRIGMTKLVIEPG